ncbi:hypothetical protein [Streptomyces sp. NPDC058964]|uniref:hypothetical protein n=1 Tax=Streptomyces sp. NPDC058964 TaxID=3346681 RepID=UPI0036C00E71
MIRTVDMPPAQARPGGRFLVPVKLRPAGSPSGAHYDQQGHPPAPSSSASTRWAVANAELAAGTPQ